MPYAPQGVKGLDDDDCQSSIDHRTAIQAVEKLKWSEVIWDDSGCGTELSSDRTTTCGEPMLALGGRGSAQVRGVSNPSNTVVQYGKRFVTYVSEDTQDKLVCLVCNYVRQRLFCAAELKGSRSKCSYGQSQGNLDVTFLQAQLEVNVKSWK
jgi:hypothetical protein